MGIVTDILGQGLIGLGKVIGVFLVFAALVSVGLAVSQDNVFGWVWALVFFVVGVGLIRYE